MHIALDMVGRGNWLGGVNYVRNLAHALRSLPPAEVDDLHLTLLHAPKTSQLAAPIAPLCDGVAVNSISRQVLRRLDYRLPLVPERLVNPWGFDLVYPCVDGYPWPGAFISWIPDFQHRYLPDLFPADELRKIEHLYARIARVSPLVVLSSQMAADDFCRIYPARAAAARILRFASQAEPAWFEGNPEAVQQKHRLPDRFFLVCNQFWQHKNHRLVIEAVGRLKAQGTEVVVACTGDHRDHRAPEYFPVLQRRMAELGVDGQIRLLGLLPRNEQMQLMRRALAVIQPSRFEGWSTVVEDARALGKQLLLSDFPVHLEQDPPGAKFFPATNAAALADLLQASWSEAAAGPELAQERQARLENHLRMQTFGREFLALAKEALAGGRP